MAEKLEGPYSRQGFVLLGRITDTEHVELAEFTPRLEDSDRDDLVDLMNKGTRYDAMLAALKNARAVLVRPGAGVRDHDRLWHRLGDAIAKAGGDGDE